MNRRKFLTGVAAGVATALYGPAKDGGVAWYATTDFCILNSSAVHITGIDLANELDRTVIYAVTRKREHHYELLRQYRAAFPDVAEFWKRQLIRNPDNEHD